MEAATSPLLILLTPPGRGAVASLRIEGPAGWTARRAVSAAAARWPTIPLRQIVVGRLGGEEIVLSRHLGRGY